MKAKIRRIIFYIVTSLVTLFFLACMFAWIFSTSNMYMLVYMKKDSDESGRAYQADISGGRFHVALTEYQVGPPYNEGVSFITVRNFQINYRYPIDRNPLTGERIVMGFEYQKFATPRSWGIFIPCYAIVGALLFFGGKLWRTFYVRHRHMIRVEKDHCVKCGYNLRGNVSARCSECGGEIQQRRS